MRNNRRQRQMNDEFGRSRRRGRKVLHPTAKVRYSIRTCTDCCIVVKEVKVTS